MLTQAQIEARRQGIGGSDVAAILGLSPWHTAVDVALEKRGECPPKGNQEAMHWGSLLEDVIALEYARVTGRRVQRVNATLRHPDHDWMLAHIDRAIVNREVAGNVRWRGGRLTTDRLLECKTANGFAAQAWGEPGSDAIPDHYLVQCQWYLGITGCEVADLAVLIGGQDYRAYSIPRDEGLIGAATQAAERFWRNLQQGIFPEPQSVEDARRLWPLHQAGKSVIVGPEVADACLRLEQLAAERKRLEEEEEQAKARITAAFGDAEEITHQGRRLATWKSQAWSRVDVTRFKAEQPQIAEQYTSGGESRVLRLNRTKG